MAADVDQARTITELRVRKFGMSCTPIVQQGYIADATDAASVIVACNHLIDRLQAFGLIE